MRLFTAIDIADDVRARLRTLLDQVRPLANMRWTPVENLHITTKFIGEWPEDRLNEIERKFDTVPKPGLIEIAIRGLGWFPNPHSPRVFWAGVQGGDALENLAKETDRAASLLGITMEARDYKPHLTLARTRDGMSKESLNSVRSAVASLASDDFGSFRASAQHLYLSAGGKYTKLANFAFE